MVSATGIQSFATQSKTATGSSPAPCCQDLQRGAGCDLFPALFRLPVCFPCIASPWPSLRASDTVRVAVLISQGATRYRPDCGADGKRVARGDDRAPCLARRFPHFPGFRVPPRLGPLTVSRGLALRSSWPYLVAFRLPRRGATRAPVYGCGIGCQGAVESGLGAVALGHSSAPLDCPHNNMGYPTGQIHSK